MQTVRRSNGQGAVTLGSVRPRTNLGNQYGKRNVTVRLDADGLHYIIEIDGQPTAILTIPTAELPDDAVERFADLEGVANTDQPLPPA